MSTTSLKIETLYQVGKEAFCFVRVGDTTTVRDLIQISASTLLPFKHDISLYGLYALPQNKWLFEDCLAMEFLRERPENEQITHYQIRPYHTVPINIRCLIYSATLPCDITLSVGDFVKGAGSVFIQYDPNFFKWNYWSLANGKQVLDPETKLGDIYRSTELILRRELKRVDKPTVPSPIFKRNIEDALARDPPSQTLPSVLDKLLGRIENYLDVEGIFRKSGLQTAIDSVAAQLDQMDPSQYDTCEKLFDSLSAHELTGLFKYYIRTLNEPLIPSAFFPIMIETAVDQNRITRLSKMKAIINSFPTPNHDILNRMTQCLSKVIVHSDNNKMQLSNLVICISPSIARNPPENKLTVLQVQALMSNVCMDLFEFPGFFFNDEPVIFDFKTATALDDYTSQSKEIGSVVKGEQVYVFQIDGNIAEIRKGNEKYLLPAYLLEPDPPQGIPKFNDYSHTDYLPKEPHEYMDIFSRTDQSQAEENISKRIKEVKEIKTTFESLSDQLNKAINRLKNDDDVTDEERESYLTILEGILFTPIPNFPFHKPC